jgi:uncharacterized phage protein gp47/JayE
MPWVRPTLPQLLARVQQDIKTRVPGSNPFLRWSSERVLGTSLAGLAHELHGRLQFLANQIVPNDTMDDSFADAAAAVWLKNPVTLTPQGRKEPSAASGPVVITATGAGDLPVNSVLERSDGALFLTAADCPFSGAGTQDVQVIAAVAGSAGNTDAGTTLTLQSPPDGISATATVDTDGIVNGQDKETTPQLVARILQAIANHTNDGAAGDYEEWALSVAGVTRAWEFPQLFGIGTVAVYIASDTAGGGVGASDTLVASVQAYLDTVRPVTVKQCTVYSIAANAIAFRIHIINPADNTTANQAAIAAAISDTVLRVSGAGITLQAADIYAAIAAGSGFSGFVLEEPTGAVGCPPGQVVTVGAVTFD